MVITRPRPAVRATVCLVGVVVASLAAGSAGSRAAATSTPASTSAPASTSTSVAAPAAGSTVAAPDYDLDLALERAIAVDQAKTLDLWVEMVSDSSGKAVDLRLGVRRADDGKRAFFMKTMFVAATTRPISSSSTPGSSPPPIGGLDDIPVPAEAEAFYDPSTQLGYSRAVTDGGSLPSTFEVRHVAPERVEQRFSLARMFTPMLKMAKVMRIGALAPKVADEVIGGMPVRSYAVEMSRNALDTSGSPRQYQGHPIEHVAFRLVVTKDSRLRLADISVTTEAVALNVKVDVRAFDTPVTVTLPSADQLAGTVPTTQS